MLLEWALILTDGIVFEFVDVVARRVMDHIEPVHNDNERTVACVNFEHDEVLSGVDEGEKLLLPGVVARLEWKSTLLQ